MEVFTWTSHVEWRARLQRRGGNNRELKDSSQKSLGEIVVPSEFSRDFHENG